MTTWLHIWSKICKKVLLCDHKRRTAHTIPFRAVPHIPSWGVPHILSWRPFLTPCLQGRTSDRILCRTSDRTKVTHPFTKQKGPETRGYSPSRNPSPQGNDKVKTLVPRHTSYASGNEENVAEHVNWYVNKLYRPSTESHYCL